MLSRLTVYKAALQAAPAAKPHQDPEGWYLWSPYMWGRAEPRGLLWDLLLLSAFRDLGIGQAISTLDGNLCLGLSGGKGCVCQAEVAAKTSQVQGLSFRVLKLGLEWGSMCTMSEIRNQTAVKQHQQHTFPFFPFPGQHPVPPASSKSQVSQPERRT